MASPSSGVTLNIRYAKHSISKYGSYPKLYLALVSADSIRRYRGIDLCERALLSTGLQRSNFLINLYCVYCCRATLVIAGGIIEDIRTYWYEIFSFEIYPYEFEMFLQGNECLINQLIRNILIGGSRCFFFIEQQITLNVWCCL